MQSRGDRLEDEAAADLEDALAALEHLGVRALAEQGLSVPGDVALVGFDDIPAASFTNPPLTTIRQDVARGAALMVQLLFDRLAGTPAESVCMAPTLVQRASA